MEVRDNPMQLNVHARTATFRNVCSAGHMQSFYVVPANARLSWPHTNGQQSPMLLPYHAPITSQCDMTLNEKVASYHRPIAPVC